MASSLKYVALDELSRTSASTLKKVGWRGLMDELRAQGRLLVTNHEKPEAVILPVTEYQAFMELLQQSEAKNEAALAGLRERFDERLAVLQERSAGERLRAALKAPARLHGKVKAGTRY